jgi:hypothetical protein
MKVRMGLLALVFLAGSVGVNAQPGGGMGRGGGMRGNPERMEKVRDQMAALRAFPVDEVWAALSLGMDVPDDTTAEKTVTTSVYLHYFRVEE